MKRASGFEPAGLELAATDCGVCASSHIVHFNDSFHVFPLFGGMTHRVKVMEE